MYNTMRVLGIACELCSMQGAQLWGFSNSRGGRGLDGRGREAAHVLQGSQCANSHTHDQPYDLLLSQLVLKSSETVQHLTRPPVATETVGRLGKTLQDPSRTKTHPKMHHVFGLTRC
jgi:hypothetical protein